ISPNQQNNESVHKVHLTTCCYKDAFKQADDTGMDLNRTNAIICCICPPHQKENCFGRKNSVQLQSTDRKQDVGFVIW
ncbi:Hypothetical predicted protein, partial [Podarcis lilfordi]